MQTARIPVNNATVHASAGSGKTYLLVSRIIQLLLNGAEPGSILAITFTRKAAAEMHQRLLQRLFALAAAATPELEQQLVELGAPIDATVAQRALNLYEQLLTTEQPVTTTTFHAFCQDLLRRFPLEAEVPAGFELLEQTGNLQDEAWEALMAEAAVIPDGPLADALDRLFKQLTLNNTRQALFSFLQQRSDWWAYTEHQTNVLAFAGERLAGQLNIRPGEDPLQAFFDEQTHIANGQRYLDYLLKRDTKTNQKLALQLQQGLDERLTQARRYQALRDTFLTQKGTIRACKSSKEMLKAYGEQGSDEFISLHHQYAEALLATAARLAAQQTWQTTTAWYLAGHHLLQHYQRIKQEQRLLDFTDLEWKSYQLLTQSDNASWVQYKLDNRIKHLLIDEFQDTNPTQWQLLLPLLEEFAAKPDEEGNSVFLVGDVKQSIYRFRRAEPRLFNTASAWLQDKMRAEKIPLNKSWRSSPAIIEFVNKLFGSGTLQAQLPEFMPHATEHSTLWGQVKLLPLVRAQEKPDQANSTELRNPLTTPLRQNDNDSVLTEGQLVADTIRSLLEQHTPIGQAETARAMQYSDILILLRSRTHVSEFEHALRQAGIPYLGAERGTLLEALEVIDMVKLLQWLLSPYDNHALASILRSPLFDATDDELHSLATGGRGNWWERLTRLAVELKPDSALSRAHRVLTHWQQLAGHIPVHDLLDKIYSEANVLARYDAAFPMTLKARVSSNLTRFLELALEIDSGRYPSLTRFLKWLENLRQKANEAPDEPPGQGQQDRVRLLTIHEAKGLEAPVVFLVDSARPLQRKTAYAALVDWADSQHRPETFLLTGKKDQLDSYSRDRQAQLFALEDREETNLLYVAVTRAQQLLFISGTEPARKANTSWYDAICEQYPVAGEQQTSPLCLHEAGQAPRPAAVAAAATGKPVAIDKRLSGRISTRQRHREIAPSRMVNELTGRADTVDEDGRQRGLIIHALLEQLTRDQPVALSRLAQRFGLAVESTLFQACLAEVQTVLKAPHLQEVFDPQCYQTARNEVPLCYEWDGQVVYGIIDRLVFCKEQILLIDYKTHRREPEQLAELVEVYTPQLQLYAEGIQKMWPAQLIKPQLLFTHTAKLLPLTE